MSYTLNSVIINPSSKSSPKNAVILCHGYGGDGNDISILANYWKTFLFQCCLNFFYLEYNLCFLII